MSTDSDKSQSNDEYCDSTNVESYTDSKNDDIQIESINKQLTNSENVEKDLNDSEIPIEKIDGDVSICRGNIVLALKCALKEMIAVSMKKGRMLDEREPSLHRFLVTLEHILRFRLKSRKTLFLENKEFWPVLESMGKYNSDAVDITRSVKDMSHLNDYYDEDSIMLSDEVDEIAGQLVSINVIDCSLALKDTNFDESSDVIDYGVYLTNKLKCEQSNLESHEFQQMAKILDQKNYLEEVNLQLKSNMSNLNLRIATEVKVSKVLRQDLENACSRNLKLQSSNTELVGENENLQSDLQKHIQTSQIDLEAERNTYETSRNGLDSMYRDMQIRMADETSLRMESEKELQLQIGMRMELEMALRLLEKDVHERQESSVGLRQQLADVKTYNLELGKRLKTCEEMLMHKLELVAKLESKNSEMHMRMEELENRLKQWHTDKIAAEDTATQLGNQLIVKDNKRCILETDLLQERELRSTLQRSLDSEKVKVNELQETETAHLSLKEEFEIAQKEQADLLEKCCEQESALSELGVHLSQSKLRVEDMKEQQAVTKEACWEDDKLVNFCGQCNKSFSVARRKHHCRNCGDIFCNECSATKMPLPSSAKPERVCDACHSILLQRYTTT